MNNVFRYKGYIGSIETSIQDRCMHGKILFINDLVTYEAETSILLQLAFQKAVDDYIETCEILGKQPQDIKKAVQDKLQQDPLY